MSKNALARIVNNVKREMQHYTMQLAFDLFCIEMRETGRLKEETCLKICQAVEKSFGEYCDIWNQDSSDKEYAMHKLDSKLAAMCPNNFTPFEERYFTDIPGVKK